MGAGSTTPKEAGTPATVVKELKAELGMTGHVSGRTVTLREGSPTRAWAASAWAVANAQHHGTLSVTVGDRTWSRSRDESGWTWQRARTPVAATSVVLRLA